MVGDPKQLPPIDSGGIMRSLSERLAGRAVSELTINHRQKTDWEKAAAE
jgi:superfamily I DNA and/or RNA helicase